MTIPARETPPGGQKKLARADDLPPSQKCYVFLSAPLANAHVKSEVGLFGGGPKSSLCLASGPVGQLEVIDGLFLVLEFAPELDVLVTRAISCLLRSFLHFRQL